MVYQKTLVNNSRGLTILEFLIVVVIFGVVLSVVLPRALRATQEAKFGQVRQYGSEIASYISQWVEIQVSAQNENSSYTLRDFLIEDITEANAGINSRALVNKYTGDDDFNGVEMLVAPFKVQKNPFNGVSYFNEVNDDRAYVPSRKPGLLYLVSDIDPSQGANYYRYFYFIYTGLTGKQYGKNANWYGQMDDRGPDAMRRGIFVARYAENEVNRR